MLTKGQGMKTKQPQVFKPKQGKAGKRAPQRVSGWVERAEKAALAHLRSIMRGENAGG